jgi:hypothetical protein
MSADNTVAIGKFTDGFRVVHAQAIENCDYADGFPKEETQAYRVVYYGDSEVFENEEAAHKQAIMLYNEMPFVEYGIQLIDYNEPFPSMTVKQAKKLLGWYDQ